MVGEHPGDDGIHAGEPLIGLIAVNISLDDGQDAGCAKSELVGSRGEGGAVRGGDGDIDHAGEVGRTRDRDLCGGNHVDVCPRRTAEADPPARQFEKWPPGVRSPRKKLIPAESGLT